MSDTSETTALQTVCNELGIASAIPQISSLLTLRELLLEWNTRFNLTGITDPTAILELHIIDSLTCLSAIPSEWYSQPLRIADIGSGAGFPGLVLAIMMPNWKLTSFEATDKKVTFQNTVIQQLHIQNASAVHMRAEAASRNTVFRLAFDIVTARALASLPVILEWGEPLLKPGGRLIAPKKGDLKEEIRQGSIASKELGGLEPKIIEIPERIRVQFPALDDGRVLIGVQQRYFTSLTYPRNGGLARKRPLGT